MRPMTLILGAVSLKLNEPEADAVSFQIDGEWPFEIAVAISPHNRYRRTDGLERLQNARSANIAEMPDFIRAVGQHLEVRRQMIVCVGQDKDAERRRHLESSH